MKRTVPQIKSKYVHCSLPTEWQKYANAHKMLGRLYLNFLEMTFFILFQNGKSKYANSKHLKRLGRLYFNFLEMIAAFTAFIFLENFEKYIKL